MSATLKFEPVRPVNGKGLDDAVKFLFRRWTGSEPVEVVLNEGHIMELRAMQLANPALHVPLAPLIEAIEKYEQVRVWEEW